ncbi:hypothetical protein [Streptomyces sp. NPDC014793]|uniref:hypothetical protein n=1 Tax=Streptomyces sp. NPDC014793 TaxID=3364914 RepID=UPI0036F4FA50
MTRRIADLDPFWVQQRAEFLATKSKSADPSACGTCRNLAAAGKAVEHDECQQRATLLHAPDHPHYEILAGFSLEENEKLPARFHIPVFDDLGQPNLWHCAVCWEEGTVVQWPCATAQKYGAQVFTPLHEAETAQKKQAAELAGYRALELGDPDGRVSASCDNPEHPTWLRKPDDNRGCPWCRIVELEATSIPDETEYGIRMPGSQDVWPRKEFRSGHWEKVLANGATLLQRVIRRGPWTETPVEDPCHPCGCPKRFDRHADGCPQAVAR